MLVSRADRGGHPRYCAELANALDAEGAEVVVIEPAAGFAAHDHAAAITNEAISGPDVGWLRQELEIAKRLLSHRKLGGLVVFQDTSPIRLVLVALLRLSRQLAPVTMVHNTEPHDRSFQERLKHVAASAALAIPHRVLVHNDDQRALLAQRPGIDADRIDVVAHGTWSTSLVGATGTPRSERTSILVFGVMRENSGIDLLVDAAAEIEREFPTLTFIVSGKPASDDVRDQLYALAQYDAFDVRPEFVDDARAEALFTAADWVLVPYVNYTSESGVLIMAISRGVPVITFGSSSVANRSRALGLGPVPPTVSNPNTDPVANLIAAIGLAADASDADYLDWVGNLERAREVFSWQSHAQTILDP